MANKKNSFNKKKTTKKSNSTTKKTSTSKKTTSTAKKTSAAKKTSVKTTTAKKTTAKKTTTTRKTTKPKVVKKVDKEDIKLLTEEPIKVEKDIKLPKLKTETKEVSTNKNKPQRVLKTEEYTVIKKEPIRYEGKEKVVPVEGKKRVTKSNAVKVEKRKKSSFLKTLGKLRRKMKIYGVNSVIPVRYLFLVCIVVLLAIFLPYVVAYFDSKASMDLSAIPDKIDQLPTVRFDMNDVPDIISSSNAFSSLKDYYEYDFRDAIGLNPTYVTSYVIKVNKGKKQAFIAVKPVDKYYDEVKSTLEKFLKENEIKNYKTLEYQGYQIFIKSSSEENDTIVVSKIKQSQQRVFNIMKDLKKDDIEKELKISDADYDEALVKIPMVVKSDTCGYVIIKPKNPSSKEKIMNLMDDYYKGLEAKWQNNEENRKLVQNRYFEEYKGYLIYIVSHDNHLAIQLLKSK